MDLIWGRYSVLIYAVMLTFGLLIASILQPKLAIFSIPFALASFVGFYDFFKRKRPVLANFPLIGRFRFLLESIRPELRQYFWESDKDELPYSRNQRSMVYQRSKEILAARPFGSDENHYIDDFTWLNHSIAPSHIVDDDFRITVGLSTKSYDISVLNISGTSFGSLSPNAIQSLSAGAKLGGLGQ